MTTLDFVRLFRAILRKNTAINAAEIERMGLLAVKIAQMYAVRPDLLSAEKCRELSRLLHRTTPLSEADFQQRWEKLAPPRFTKELSDFSRQPLASASLGQVHRGRLNDGTPIAIKIARADGREAFLRDVALFRRLVKLALIGYPPLERLADPVGALEAVERQTLTEMNFLSEAAGASRLQRLAAERAPVLPHLASLRFPRYFPDLSSESFLVSEFIEGPPLAESLAQRKLPYDALLALFRLHGYFLFVRGEFHGDLHPGNVIWQDGTFWFIDNATIETVPPAFSRGLFHMMLHLGAGNTGAAAASLTDLSTTPLTREKTAAFRARFTDLYRNFAGKTVAEISLTQQMMDTVKLAVRSGLTFPRGAFPLIKSLMYLDGMVLQCAPDAVLLRDVARFADDFAGPVQAAA